MVTCSRCSKRSTFYMVYIVFCCQFFGIVERARVAMWDTTARWAGRGGGCYFML